MNAIPPSTCGYYPPIDIFPEGRPFECVAMMVSRRYGVTSVVQVCTTSNQRAAFGTHVTVKGPDRIGRSAVTSNGEEGCV